MNMFYFPFYTSPYFYPAQLPEYSQPSLQPDPAISQPVYQNPPCQQNITDNASKEKDEQIVLTREDLQAAGYVSLKKIWTQEEDKRLLHYKDKKKLDWLTISKKIRGRNKKMCYSRYRRLTSSPKDQWLKKNDQDLKRYVQEMGEDWEQIAKRFKNRNARQVKDRYNNFLRPGLTDDEWTLQQDFILVEIVKQHGKNWKLLEEALTKRSLNQIKNRFYGRIKRLNDRKLNKLKIEESCSQ